MCIELVFFGFDIFEHFMLVNLAYSTFLTFLIIMLDNRHVTNNPNIRIKLKMQLHGQDIKTYHLATYNSICINSSKHSDQHLG